MLDALRAGKRIITGTVSAMALAGSLELSAQQLDTSSQTIANPVAQSQAHPIPSRITIPLSKSLETIANAEAHYLEYSDEEAQDYEAQLNSALGKIQQKMRARSGIMAMALPDNVVTSFKETGAGMEYYAFVLGYEALRREGFRFVEDNTKKTLYEGLRTRELHPHLAAMLLSALPKKFEDGAITPYPITHHQFPDTENNVFTVDTDNYYGAARFNFTTGRFISTSDTQMGSSTHTLNESALEVLGYQVIAYALLEDQKPTSALAATDKKNITNQSIPLHHFLRGLAYAQQENHGQSIYELSRADNALSSFNELSSQSTSFPWVLYPLAQQYLRTGDATHAQWINNRAVSACEQEPNRYTWILPQLQAQQKQIAEKQKAP